MPAEQTPITIVSNCRSEKSGQAFRAPPPGYATNVDQVALCCVDGREGAGALNVDAPCRHFGAHAHGRDIDEVVIRHVDRPLEIDFHVVVVGTVSTGTG